MFLWAQVEMPHSSPRGSLPQPKLSRAPSQTAQGGAGRMCRAYRPHSQGAGLPAALAQTVLVLLQRLIALG